ncbi:hypothetical protein ABT56_22355, partial [Photobacterium aquae]
MEQQVISKATVITNVKGSVFYIDVNGEQHFIQSGDTVPAGAIVISLAGSSYEFTSPNVSFNVEGQCATCDSINEGVRLKSLDSDDEIARLQQAILDGVDPTEDFDAPAAGLGVSSVNAGFVEITRLGRDVIADAGHDTDDVSFDVNGLLGNADSLSEGVPKIFLDGPITSDNIINIAESQSDILITGHVEDGVKPGVEVNIIVGDHTFVTTVGSDGSFSIYVPGSVLADNSEVKAELVTSNGTSEDTHEYDVDVYISIPEVTILGDGGDNVFNKTELGEDGTATVTVTVPESAEVGEIIIIRDANNNVLVEKSLTEDDITNGFELEVLPVDDRIYVSAEVIDGAGNSSGLIVDEAEVDVWISSPIISLPSSQDTGVSDSDSLTNITSPSFELSNIDDDVVSIRVTVVSDETGKVQEGDASLVDGNWVFRPSSPLVDGAYTITAVAQDDAGNEASSNTIQVTIDSSILNPSIDFESTGFDDVYNSDELGPDGTVTATITIPSDFNPETDSMLINGESYHPSESEILSGLIELQVAPDSTITTQITDAAGNVSSLVTGTAPSADTEALPPVIFFESPGADGIYNAQEVGPDGTVTATISLPSDFIAGLDTLYINGQVHVLTSEEASLGYVNIEVVPNTSVSAYIKDSAGNTSELVSEKAPPADLSASTPIVELLGDANNDGIYNDAELGGNSTVPAKITLAPDTVEGDRIIIKDTSGNVLVDREVTADDLTNGILVETPVVGDKVEVTAQVIDKVGNTSPEASDSALVDTGAAPAPSVELLGDSNNDGIYNSAELGADGTVTAKVTLASGTVEGDRIIITDTNGNVLVDREVTAADLTNGILVEGSVVGDKVEVTAQVIDKAGNPSLEATDSAVVDNSAAAPAVELLGDSNSDGIYNSAELGADGTVTAKVTLASGTVEGDRIIITDTNGNVLVDREVTADDLTNGIVVEGSVVGDKVEVTAQVIDKVGNPSPEASDSALVDTGAAPAPSVELLGDSNSDGIYNSAELGADGTVTAKVTLASGTVEGDRIIITDINGNVLVDREVTADDLTNGIVVEGSVVGDKVEVTAQVI